MTYKDPTKGKDGTAKPPPKPSPDDKEKTAKANRDLVSTAVSDPASVSTRNVGKVADAVNNLTVAELQNHARTLAVKIGGKKAELAARLIETIKAKRQSATAPVAKKPAARPVEKPKEKPTPALKISATHANDPVGSSIVNDPQVIAVYSAVRPLADKISESRDKYQDAQFAYDDKKSKITELGSKYARLPTKERDKKIASETARITNSAAYKKAKENLSRARAEHEAAKSEFHAKLAEVMAPENPVKIAGSLKLPDAAAKVSKNFGTMDATKENLDCVQAATKFYSSLTNGAEIKVTYGVSKSGRAFASQDSKGNNVALIGKQLDANATDWEKRHHTETMVHELGHVLEMSKPGLRRMTREFVAYRTKDEKPTNLAEKFPAGNFGPDEVGKKDKFDQAFGGSNSATAYYVGKTYSDGDTEIMSMGMEKLFADPARLVMSDPEFFGFLVKALKL